MKKILFFMGWLMSCSIYSQSELKVFQDWMTTAGTQHFFYKNVTRTDGSGNVYVAGATQTAAGDYDILLAKFNNSGVQQWIRQIDGAAHYQDFATSIQLDGSGNVYITGAITNDTVNHFSDLIAVKYNSGGTEQWRATYDGASLYDCGTDIFVATNGTVVVTGSSYNASVNLDFVSISYNSSGIQQFVARYDHTSSMDDVPVRIIKSGSSIYISGAVQTGTGTYDWAEVKYNTSGVQQAVKISSGGTTGIEEVHAMVQDASGNLYLAGMTPTLSNGYDYDIIKLDSSLNIVWEHTYDGADHLNDIANGIQVSASGDVYVTGSSGTSAAGDDYLTLKYNSSGSLIWTRTFNDSLNGNDIASAMAMDNSGKIIITGSALTDSLNNLNYYTIKYDTAGTVQWSITFDGDRHLNDRATNIAIDTVGAIVVTGASETATGVFEYATVRYVEKEVITPTDYSSERPQTGFDYFENKGQLLATDSTLIPEVKYYSTSMQPSLYFKDHSYSLVFVHADSSAAQDTLHRIDVTYFQSNPNAKTYALDEQSYYNNYYYGHIPEGITEVHSNKRLVTPNLYSNIDVEYSSNQDGFKYYFIIKPGAFPSTIKMEYTGASSFSLDGTTNELTINSSVGSITYARPTVYQINSSNVIVPVTGWTADWQTNGASNKYKFNTGVYDSTKTLIIMVKGVSRLAAPWSLTDGVCWSTYLGGGDLDQPVGVDVDLNGNQFVAGLTFSSTILPITTGAFQGNINLGYDAFLFKFTTNHFLRWGTYLGGSSNDGCTDVKIRTTGNNDPYIVGNTPSGDFPIVSKAGAHNDAAIGGSQDGYIAEFDNNFGFAKWITYFGGNGSDLIWSLDFDSSDRLFISGQTGSATGITSIVPSGAYTQSYVGSDAFLARFTPSDTYDWYTPYGGTGQDVASCIKIDHADNVVIYGTTSSGNLPTTNPPGSGDFFDNSYNGSGDLFIARFSFAGAVQWATYIGGNDYDQVGNNALAFNLSNDIYIGGSTRSSNFPLKNSGAYFDSSFTGNDAFLMKFDGANYDTLLSTYISGNSYGNNINLTSISVNKDDEVYVSGITGDTAFPVFQQGGFYYQDTLSGTSTVPDAFFMAFDQWDHEILGTYYGGYELGYQEQITDMAVYKDYLYAVGQTNSKDTNGIKRFPLFDAGGVAYYDSTYNGGIYDGFVSMFCIGAVVGIGEYDLSHDPPIVFAYPNPATDRLNIEISRQLDQNAVMEVYSIDGKLVYSYTLLKHQQLMNIDISNLSHGLYFLRVYNTGFNSTVKFSKN